MYPKYYHKFTVSDFLSLISGIFINKSEKARLLLRKIYGNKIFFFFDSGRTCLSILLKALNYPKYSELIVPINCCPVVPEAIKLNELVPVYVDIDNNLTILPEDLDRKITTKTRGVICVAQYGNVPDYGKIISICKKNNIDIIQDLAHTFTATYRENYLTEIGIASFFSLGVTKSITTFEGGILLLNDQKIDMDIISKYLKKRENIFTCFKRIAKFLFFVFGTKPPIYRLFTKRLVNLAKSMSFYQPKHRVL
ncbi:MAG: DegT/DnrJ/EryC1/StrS family aminotransferase [Methanosarcinales archaeon]